MAKGDAEEQGVLISLGVEFVVDVLGGWGTRGLVFAGGKHVDGEEMVILQMNAIV